MLIYQITYASWEMWPDAGISFSASTIYGFSKDIMTEIMDVQMSLRISSFINIIPCIFINMRANVRNVSSFLAHLSWKLKWAFLIAFRPPSVCLSVRPSVNFSYFQLLLKNHWAISNQTWHKAFFGKGDSVLFKWRALSSSKRR